MCGTNLDDMVNRLILFLCALKGVTTPKCYLKATEDVAGSDGSSVPDHPISVTLPDILDDDFSPGRTGNNEKQWIALVLLPLHQL